MKRILFALLAFGLTIQIGDSRFWAVLYDNTSTQALPERMPLTLSMSELNGNEKYHYLSEGLPTDAERVGNINAGDLMTKCVSPVSLKRVTQRVRYAMAADSLKRLNLPLHNFRLQ